MEKNLINQQKVAEFEKEHGRIAHFELDGKLYAFRALSLEETEDYQEALQNKRRGVAAREVAQIALIYPDLDDLKALFQKRPLASARISDALLALAGAEIELTVKKD